jgi:hypothetical protein
MTVTGGMQDLAYFINTELIFFLTFDTMMQLFYIAENFIILVVNIIL